MMLLMPLLAVALAIPPKRSTSALGVFVSIILVVSYHKINQYGEDIAALGRIDPIIALWGPFFVFAALIIWMYYRTALMCPADRRSARWRRCSARYRRKSANCLQGGSRPRS